MIKTTVRRLIETILMLLAVPLVVAFGISALAVSGSGLHQTRSLLAWMLISGGLLATVIGLLYVVEKKLWADNNPISVSDRKAPKAFLIIGLTLAGLIAATMVVVVLIAVGH